MQYKIGQKVKITRAISLQPKNTVGKKGVITKIVSCGNYRYYGVKLLNSKYSYCKNEQDNIDWYYDDSELTEA